MLVQIRLDVWEDEWQTRASASREIWHLGEHRLVLERMDILKYHWL